MTSIERIADYVIRTKYSDIPESIIERAKECLLDSIGVTLYGTTFEASRIASTFMGKCVSEKSASVFGIRDKTLPHLAAFANAVMAHVADFDDVMLSLRGHTSCVLMPVVLAAIEYIRGDGKDLLTAFVVGSEVVGKIGEGAGWGHYQLGWHSTGTIGTLAAAAAASKVLKLDRSRVSNALGIACSSASGLRVNFGTMTTSFNNAHAAMMGMLAAQLAEKGFDASPLALEGPTGFAKVFGCETDLSSVAENLGNGYSLDRIMLKPYPCCAGTHPAVEAVLKMRKRFDFRLQDIVEIEVMTRPLMSNVLIHHNPQNALEAKYSMEFCISAALVFGQLGIREFEEDRIFHRQVRSLMDKVRIISNDKMEQLSVEQDTLAPTRIALKLAGGKEYCETISEAKGGPSNPMDHDEILTKFRECAQKALYGSDVEMLLESIEGLENLKEISQLTELMTK